MKASRQPIKRPNMRRAVILFPSGFTLGNLFFGVFAIIAASRLEFTTAGVYVMLGGMCDALDGRVARATNSGTEFGEELDSLVDAITFGLAPAMIMYFAVLNRDGWDWIFVFLFCACAVLRLARFNIEQAGTAKTYFQGLPSPAAGITLASYYWFSQSWLYSYGAIGDLPWHRMLRFIMAGLAMLMISNVPYPNFPRTGFRSIKAALASLLLIVCAVLFFWVHRLEFFFPMALLYIGWGLFRWIFFGLFERRQPTIPYDLSEGEDEEDEREYIVPQSTVHAERQHRRLEPVARTERGRGRAERPEAAERPARPEREPRAPRTEVVARPDADATRAERPERTEAERAARREKREKRDAKRGKRDERPERPARTAPAGAPDEMAGVTEPTLALVETAPPAMSDEQVIGTIPGGAEGESATGSAAPGRKRKRRRRRGARDRGEGAPSSESGEGGGDEGGFEDEGGDESPSEGASRSPYSAPPAPTNPEHPAPAPSSAAPRPFTPPLPAPSPAPTPAPAPAPPAPTSNPSEPGE